MKILGVDPGLITTGYGVLEVRDRELSLLEGGAIHIPPSKGTLGSTLTILYRDITGLLETYHPDALALEDLYSHYKHPYTAILMGHARGVICLAAAQRDIPIFSYPATQIKLCLTGDGRATKEQMQRAVKARLNLEKIPKPHDVADALGVALCHHFMKCSPIMAAVESERPAAGSRG